ncbi:isoprenoid synthase domain-containing protein [Aspergillus karnatakaensis]|uniref:FPP/GGPP synthase family protein n=1 Tax=Aspergillus karnatakaensis TaxID=1810916 RepID=UPI003CCE00ED
MDTARQRFREVRHEVLDQAGHYLSQRGTPVNFVESIKTCIHENLLGTRMHRGLTVIYCGNIRANGSPTDKQLTDLCRLAWLPEIFQAAYTIWDDIIDNSTTRRGQVCWFRRPGVGLSAINDACIIRSMMFGLLQSYFSTHPRYIHLVELLQECSLRTELGQFTDAFSAGKRVGDPEYGLQEVYEYMVLHKSTYYSGYFPIMLAYEYMGLATAANRAQLIDILEPLGMYFQIQNDVLDVYGPEIHTGKQGSDVAENKCTWLITRAMELGNDKQRTVLIENYGATESRKAEAVLTLYEQLNLESVYRQYEESENRRLYTLIDGIDESLGVRREVIRGLYNGFKREREYNGLVNAPELEYVF